jgi:Uma2 family endonuclease
MRVEYPDMAIRTSAVFTEDLDLLDDDAFFDFCMQNPNLRIERLATGEIIIMPPTGLESSYQNNEIAIQLGYWAKIDGRGVAFDSNAEFILESGAAFGPDAAWLRKDRLAKFTKREKQRFGRICPDFIIELRSPSDRMTALKAKMAEWMRNGVQLAWLIDAKQRSVWVYRQGEQPTELRGIDRIEGEAPVEGFQLDLTPVWEGL